MRLVELKSHYEKVDEEKSNVTDSQIRQLRMKNIELEDNILTEKQKSNQILNKYNQSLLKIDHQKMELKELQLNIQHTIKEKNDLEE